MVIALSLAAAWLVVCISILEFLIVIYGSPTQ